MFTAAYHLARPDHIKPLHMITPYFFKIYFSIIIPTMPGSSKWPLIFPPKPCLQISSSTCITHVLLTLLPQFV